MAINNNKKVAISVGPIPARLDSVKFLTNKFKGGLAMKTAAYLADKGHDVTVIMSTLTEPTNDLRRAVGDARIVRIRDVFEYYDWFVAHARDFDAFVMAGAVANLTPVKPYEGKFPSHDYKPGEEFDIRFMIAPRAIDAIKPLNPRACLIGYKLFDAADDDELVEIARHTLRDAKANLIFANRPSDAKSRKLAVTADNSVIPCTFDEHLELIDRAIRQEYYKTKIYELTPAEQADPNIREALALASLFEKTFDAIHFGTVAIPVRHGDGAFATTSRGHKSGPVLVRHVNHGTRTVYATGKATLNAPTLAAMLDKKEDVLVIHRHDGDPNYADRSDFDLKYMKSMSMEKYMFPGTREEAMAVRHLVRTLGYDVIKQAFHGYLKLAPIAPVDWNKYHELFPARYFKIPDRMAMIIDEFAGKETLELGANESSDARYAYDPYVRAEGAINLTWNEILAHTFDLAYAKNAVNYMSLDELKAVLDRSGAFVANTFLEAPREKTTETESAVLDGTTGMIRHNLWIPGDSVMRHEFHAYGKADYEALGLTVTPYGRNSALLTKNIPAD